MGWIKVKDGYVRSEAVDYVRRSTYLYDNKYRLLFDLFNGDVAIFDEYDTREECEKDIDTLINEFLQWIYKELWRNGIASDC